MYILYFTNTLTWKILQRMYSQAIKNVVNSKLKISPHKILNWHFQNLVDMNNKIDRSTLLSVIFLGVLLLYPIHCRGRDRMLVGFTTTCAISTCHHWSCEFESCSGEVYSTLCDKVCQWFTAGQWFSPGTLVSSTNKTDRHDVAEILFKMVLSTINQTISLLQIRNIKHLSKYYVLIPWYVKSTNNNILPQPLYLFLAIRADPSNTNTMWERCRLFEEIGDHKRALEGYISILRHLPDNEAEKYLQLARSVTKVIILYYVTLHENI